MSTKDTDLWLSEEICKYQEKRRKLCDSLHEIKRKMLNWT